MITIKFTTDTVLKRKPVQSSEVPDTDLCALKEGQEFPLHSWDMDEDYDGNVKIAFLTDSFKGFNTWFAFSRHVEIYKDGELIFPEEEQTARRHENDKEPVYKAETYQGKLCILPGHPGVRTEQPIYPGCDFTWGEALHDGVRIPKTKSEVDNIIALAKELQKVRDQIKKPIRVTSWFRPEPFNSRVGGAKFSTHKDGRGVDIAIEGMSGRDIGNAVSGWWKGGLGIYPGNRKHILHLDIGKKRKWGF